MSKKPVASCASAVFEGKIKTEKGLKTDTYVWVRNGRPKLQNGLYFHFDERRDITDTIK